MTASKVRRRTTHQAAACGGSALRWTLSEHQSLVYWLCGEAGRRAASEWASYIGSLPRDFGSVPLYALSGEGPSSSVAAGSPEARWVAAHLPRPMRLRLAAQQARLFADWSATAAFLAAAGLAPLRGWRLYVWAWLAVNTRCIHLGAAAASQTSAGTAQGRPAASGAGAGADTMALAPVLDFLNHSETADVETHFDQRTGHFVIRTQRAFARGQEVFISYGPHDNRFMLLEYGFVLARNPFQVLELDDAVSAWVAAAEARLLAARPAAALMRPDGLRRLVDTLRQHGLWGDFTISLDDLEPSYRLQAALRLLLAAEQRGATAKGAIARWERWRRGGPTEDAEGAENAAVRAWVEAVCARLAAEAERMLVGTAAASLAQPGVDAFLVRCLHTVWLEISAIATPLLPRRRSDTSPCM
ncbi:hypothetical protein BX661DRAFT_39713 [Kickxella alabastrina]|uniref:uncharacterized protein n=1 Tax=Kickxella alabastrina TaxID=61397 RepID=UPI00221F3896|nr:uncharacterized protein BX661DRAFT_39713 [Kickxella alabastrina]KAI7825558.1 hypothetical protein BX661DRAFT_39713 [Kickxella alabastrina]